MRKAEGGIVSNPIKPISEGCFIPISCQKDIGQFAITVKGRFVKKNIKEIVRLIEKELSISPEQRRFQEISALKARTKNAELFQP